MEEIESTRRAKDAHGPTLSPFYDSLQYIGKHAKGNGNMKMVAFFPFIQEDLHKILTREIVSVFDNLLLDYKPQIIYTHWNHDSHQDHHIISQAVLSATRHNQCDVYMFEQIIPGGIMPYSFRAQKIVDISKYINSKVLSLKAHKSQMKKNKYDWIVGIRGRASQWGYTIGVKYAEAFEVVKIIEK